MKSLTIKPSVLKGEMVIPPSKSLAHRSIICAFLAEGTSIIDNVELSNDIVATCNAISALGADIDILESGIEGRKKFVVRGKGTVKAVKNTIQCGESGTTARFIIPISRLTNKKITIEGEGMLVERPFTVFYEIFEAQGIQYETANGKLPLVLEGQMKPGDFKVRGDISSQFISGLLLMLPLLSGNSTITVTTPLESIGYIDMTLDMQKRFGVSIEFNRQNNSFFIPGWQKYSPQKLSVEGDWSQAAFWMAAGAISGPVAISGLNPDSLQGDKVIEGLLKEMGASVIWQDSRLVTSPGAIKGMRIDASQCPDLVPILAVLGSVGEGETEIDNAVRLRIKECDRLKAIATELKAIGANITEREDGLLINGVQKLTGGQVYGWNDHRIVMAAAIAAAACDKTVTIEGCEAVNKSYPTFWKHYLSIGGEIL